MDMRTSSRPYLATIVTMVSLAIVWLSYQFWRLLLQMDEMGAVDLRLRHTEVTSFFAGEPIYQTMGHAVYPPATYLLLWPLIGWMSESAARIGWAVMMVILLGVLLRQVIQVSQATSPPQRWLWRILPLAMYATGATIGNGQLAVHILPCLLAALIVLNRSPTSQPQKGWREDMVVALLMIAALVKPNVTAPFFWIIMVKSLRAASFTVLGYGLLTVVAPVFQPEYGPITLFQAWLIRGVSGAAYGSTEGQGSIVSSISAHSILGALDLSEWNKPASLVILFGLGLWILWNRQTSVWILASVAAIGAKIWTYHGWYDDLILLVPMLELYRQSDWGAPARSRAGVARILFIAMVLFTLAPGGIYLFPPPWNSLYLTVQMLVIGSSLIRLGWETQSQP